MNFQPPYFLLILFLGSLFLTGCVFYQGDPTCVQRCEMNSDKSKYIFKNSCDAKDIFAPANSVARCNQCPKEQFSIDGHGSMSLALSYPGFVPIKEFSGIAEKTKEKISISISEANCPQKNHYNNPAERRSQSIEEFLNSRLNSKRDKFAMPKNLGSNLYVARNYAEFSADEEIFYLKTPAKHYDFVALCHRYGCSSPSNPIEGTPYVYEYNFSKPSKNQDIVLIHKAVKKFVLSVYSQEIE